MKYYLHDTSAFDDEKVAELFINFGYEGVGLFYVILEKLGRQEKPVKTEVLKRQLRVGKKLEKCWNFMESIGIISSNNGETFNKQLLNFSEKFLIKKEKTRKKVEEWRKNQEDTENVTSYVPNCNHSKDNISKDNISKDKKEIDKEGESGIDFDFIIESFNKICTCFPKVLKLNNSRKLKIKTRLSEMQNDLNVIDVLFYKIQSSEFLKGRNDKKWQATFDWVFENDKNWLKVIEGNYDNKQGEKKETFLEISDRKARELLIKMKENEFARNNQ